MLWYSTLYVYIYIIYIIYIVYEAPRLREEPEDPRVVQGPGMFIVCVCIYMCICIYICIQYIYIERERDIYMYTYIVYDCMIYIYIEREREIEI